MKNTSILIPIILIGCLTALGFLLYKALQTVENERPRVSRQIVLNEEDYAEEDAPADIGKATDYDAQTADPDDGIVPDPVSRAENATTSNTGDNEMQAMTAAEKRAAIEADRREDERRAAAAERERLAASRAANERTASTSGSAGSTGSSFSGSANRGRYLVIAGSFRQKTNAQEQVERLISAGFQESRLELFNRGTYAVALADQTNRYTDAEKTAARIRQAGFEARVMRRR